MNTVQKLAVGCQDAFDRCSWRCPAGVLSDTHWGRVALSAHPGGGSGFLGRIERFGTRISDKKARAIRLVALDCLPTNLTARNDYSLRPHTTHPTTLEAVPRRRNSAKKKPFLSKKKRKKSRWDRKDVPVEGTWDLTSLPATATGSVGRLMSLLGSTSSLKKQSHTQRTP